MSRRLVYFVGWAILTVLVIIAVRKVDWTLALYAMYEAKPLILILAVLLNAMILIFATIQWLVFLPEGVSVTKSRMFEIIAVTSTVSNSGPVGGGAAVGLHLLAKHGGLGHSVGLSVLLLDQLVEGLAKIAILLLGIVAIPIGIQYRAVGGAIILGIPILILLLTIVARRRHTLSLISQQTKGFWGWVLRTLTNVSVNLQVLRKPKKLSATFILALLQKLAEALAIMCVLMAFEITIPLWGVLAVLVAVNLSTVVSITPANLGVFEGSAFLVYQALGVGSDMAITLALIQHIVYLIPLAGIGWIVSSVKSLRVNRSNPDFNTD